MIDEKTTRNVERLKRNAALLQSFFRDAPRRYERVAVALTLVASTVLPIGLSNKLYYAVSLLLAKNPRHRYAVETMRLFEEQRR